MAYGSRLHMSKEAGPKHDNSRSTEVLFAGHGICHAQNIDPCHNKAWLVKVRVCVVLIIYYESVRLLVISWGWCGNWTTWCICMWYILCCWLTPYSALRGNASASQAANLPFTMTNERLTMMVFRAGYDITHEMFVSNIASYPCNLHGEDINCFMSMCNFIPCRHRMVVIGFPFAYL